MTWIPRSLSDMCDASRTALVVYDMQVGIVSQVKGAETIVGQCAAVLDAARSAGMRVAFTRHLSSPSPWMGSTQLRTAMAWQHKDDPTDVVGWFPRGAPAAEIVPELAPRDDELVVDKLSMSAFESTFLAFALRDCGITGVALCGIALEIGIEPTVRHATDLGFIPILIEDACGSGNADAGADARRLIEFVGEAVITDVESFRTHAGSSADAAR